jgi:hypothetical protein
MSRHLFLHLALISRRPSTLRSRARNLPRRSCLEDGGECAGKARPLFAMVSELFPSRRGQRIHLSRAGRLRLIPLGTNEVTRFEPVQRWIERAGVDREDVAEIAWMRWASSYPLVGSARRSCRTMRSSVPWSREGDFGGMMRTRCSSAHHATAGPLDSQVVLASTTHFTR